MTPVWYNARKAAQVAAFFAIAEGGKINVLKLVKLIYLADRLALDTFEAPILSDKFVSMDHGPVNSITLNHINGFADEDTRGAWDSLVTDRKGHFIGVRNARLSVKELDELSKAEIKILKLIWERFGKMNQFEVRDYTHKNCPEWEDPCGSSEPIPVVRIFKFLGKKDSSELAAKLESERLMDQTFARADELPAEEDGDSAYAIRAAG
jgi:uncharacterized phage-associated protein